MFNRVLTIFFTMFVVIDPIGIVPIFLSLAADQPPRRRAATIFKASLIAFLVLCLFIFLGSRILATLGIQPGSFSIAGGILLFVISMDMLLGQPRRTSVSPTEMEAHDISVFPLAIPLLGGPGAITAILLFVSGDLSLPGLKWILVVSVLAILAVAAAAMFLSSLLLRLLGRTGVSVLERLMGIIVSGLSVQFVFDGLQTLRIV